MPKVKKRIQSGPGFAMPSNQDVIEAWRRGNVRDRSGAMPEVKKLKTPRYWFCIIGPIDDSKLPFGADFQPRMAAREAVHVMTGDDSGCRSGWIHEPEYQRITNAMRCQSSES